MDYSEQADGSAEIVLWVNANPSFKALDLPLLKQLSTHCTVARWEYRQDWDEASSLEMAVELLGEYLQTSNGCPVHLAGHGLSGSIAAIAAARYPDRVQSLTLLSVAPQPSLTWQSYYYWQRLATYCSQERILAQLAKSLFGPKLPTTIQTIVALLQKDLWLTPTPHSLASLQAFTDLKLAVPTLIGSGSCDFVVEPIASELWAPQLMPCDRSFSIPDGYYFFHQANPARVAQEMVQFFQSIGPRVTTIESDRNLAFIIE